MSFTTDLQKFQKETLAKYVEVKRQSAFDLFSSIVIATPVDKGVLKNNWFVEIGSPSLQVTDSADKTGDGTIARIKRELAGTDLIKDIFFTNNLPYGPVIEFEGHSGKAPEGMVRVNTRRWDSIVANNTKEANRGF